MAFQSTVFCGAVRWPAGSRLARCDPRLKSLNLQLRFLAPLLVTLVAAAYFALPLMDRLTLRWFARDLNMRGSLVTNTLSDSIADALSDAKGARLQTLFDRAVQDERLFAIGLCSLDGTMLRSSASFPRTLDCPQAQAAAALPEPRLRLAGGAVHVGVHTVESESGPIARLVLLQDLSFIDRRSQDTRRYLLLFIGALGLIDRVDHRGCRATQLARLGVRRSWSSARRRLAAADDGDAGNGAAGRRDPCPHA